MGLDYYYNAFGDDPDESPLPEDPNDGTNSAQTIDPHLTAKLLLGTITALSLFTTLVHILFQIELGKKITETAAGVPDDMVLTEEPPPEKGGTIAVVTNASVVRMPDHTPGPAGIERRQPKASAVQSLEQGKMAELVVLAAAVVLMVYLLLVNLPGGNVVLSVVGITCVTGLFLKDQVKSEWRKERYDRILTVVTLILFIASSLSFVTYATMGIVEGTIYTGSARIVGYDDAEYTNSADERITRIDLEVSWGGAWGCPRMDKTCYAVVQGALCEQKDDRALRQLGQMEGEEEDDEVIYDENGDETVIKDVEFDDDTGSVNELAETTYYKDGAQDTFIDIQEDDSNGDYEAIVEDVYYTKDGSLGEIEVEEYSEDADGSSSDTEEVLEYNKINGTDELVESEVFTDSNGEEEDELTEYTYKDNGGAEELVAESVIDETVDEEGDVVEEETDYNVVDGVVEEVTEDVSTNSTDVVGDDDEDKSAEIEELKEELKEANEENEELKASASEDAEILYYEEATEEIEEEEVEELEDEVYYGNQNTYSFEDDSYEDEYWSGNNWDDTWGDYECQELFETTDLDSNEFDANTPPGKDDWPFVNIYGKCNSCDAYLIDYFSTEHFNSIKAYETRGVKYGLVGLLSLILTAAHAFRQSKRPGKERELQLIPNENSNVV